MPRYAPNKGFFDLSTGHAPKKIAFILQRYKKSVKKRLFWGITQCHAPSKMSSFLHQNTTCFTLRDYTFLPSFYTKTPPPFFSCPHLFSSLYLLPHPLPCDTILMEKTQTYFYTCYKKEHHNTRAICVAFHVVMFFFVGSFITLSKATKAL